ncbi:DUF2207 domain-containing protein [Anaerocolumna chitinilytica]|uniref:DUF2207 domain-containing protein n=1 Tax=Anaerocolumna chitinilytica TaxID=1727145 RepID=A0A7I8DPS1_9FIRM|nr:DUF2207 domain-containing protein [Anaerocolumna chitinilytica]BCJ99075.1 hypothetical protein bsdcttw_21160 [Anaerocolumna chitinilytica]
MKWKSFIRTIFIVAAIVICFTEKADAAQTFEFQMEYNGYSIKGYDIFVKVEEDASMDITERITVSFSREKHGIYRVIPFAGTFEAEGGAFREKQRYLAKISQVSVQDGDTKEVIPYSLHSDNGSLTIKIGDSKHTLTGEKTYELHYHYGFRANRNTKGDILSYNLIGTGWDTTISHIRFTLDMPKEFDAKNLLLYSGRSDSHETADITWALKGNSITGSVQRILEPGEGLSIQLPLTDGYFTKKKEWLPLGESILFGGMAVISLLLWFRFGRSGQVKITEEYVPPKQLSPAGISYVLEGNVSRRAISAMILYWANLGYLYIADEGKHILRLVNGRDPGEDIPGYEKQLLRKLFEGRDEVKASDLKEDFQAAVEEFKRALREELEGTGQAMHEKKAKYGRLGGYLISAFIIALLTGQALSFTSIGVGGFLLTLFISLMLYLMSFVCSAFLGYFADRLSIGKWLGFLIFGVFYGLLLWFFAWWTGKYMLQPLPYSVGGLAAGISAIFGAFSGGRTKYGGELLGQVLGYRRVLLQKGKRGEEKEEEFSYKELPYAFVFGRAKKWASAFKKLEESPPSWYMGPQNMGFEPVFYMMYLERGMGGFEVNMSSGSDSAGGVGGGVGGGGGGSW